LMNPSRTKTWFYQKPNQEFSWHTIDKNLALIPNLPLYTNHSIPNHLLPNHYLQRWNKRKLLTLNLFLNKKLCFNPKPQNSHQRFTLISSKDSSNPTSELYRNLQNLIEPKLRSAQNQTPHKFHNNHPSCKWEWEITQSWKNPRNGFMNFKKAVKLSRDSLDFLQFQICSRLLESVHKLQTLVDWTCTPSTEAVRLLKILQITGGSHGVS
jgi:hypothetical protein